MKQNRGTGGLMHIGGDSVCFKNQEKMLGNHWQHSVWTELRFIQPDAFSKTAKRADRMAVWTPSKS
jgi:hypothetical protein